MKILPQHKKRLEILKKIILEYQETDSRESLHKILQRIDNLVLSIIAKERRYRKYLYGISCNDLYQYGIIGAIAGIKSIPKDEDIRYIPARVVAYIRAQLRKTYRHKLHEISDVGIVDEMPFPKRRDEYHEMHSQIDANDIKKRIDELYNLGKLTAEDMLIIQKRFFEDMKYKDIAVILNVQLPTAWHRYKMTMKKIQHLLGSDKCNY